MRRAVRALVAAWWTGLVVGVAPLVLARLVGRPLPDRLPDPVGPVDPQQMHQLLRAGAAMFGWLAWATLAAVVLPRSGRLVTAGIRRLPGLRLPGPLRGLSAAVLGTVAVTTATTAAPTAAHAAVATTSAVPPHRPAGTGQHPVTGGPAQPHVTAQAGNRHRTSTVRGGDTLWGISAARLGNPRRWPEIYRLNRDRYDRHGRMHHGNHIEPGWVLVLPDDATPPAPAGPAPPAPPTRPSRPPQQPAGPPPMSPAPGSASPAGSAVTASPARPTGSTGIAAAAPTSTGPDPASATPPATRSSPQPSPRHANSPGIALPGGSWVDLGLAAAITAAAALVWIQRRRRYIPHPPSPAPRLDDPDLAPVPPVVTKVRRGLRRAAVRPSDAGVAPLRDANPARGAAALEDGDHDVDLGGAFDPGTEFDGGFHDAEAEDRNLSPGEGEVPDEQATPSLDPELVPLAPALNHPLLQVWPPAGLGLTGPGGEAAARGFLVAALAADALDEPQARSRVVIPAATLATLLGAGAVPVADTPRLSVTAGLPEALELLEAATLHRTRLVYEHEVDTVTALRDADPLEEPLPPLLLIADATAVHQRARIAALLTQGQRLDIHGVLSGEWADGNTVHVATDGTTSRVDGDGRHGAHAADVGRLAVLDPTETADLLRTLAEAHTGQRQPAAPVEALPPAASPLVGAPNDEKASSARPQAAPGDTADPDRAAQATPTGQAEPVLAAANAMGAAVADDAQPVRAVFPMVEPGTPAAPAVDDAAPAPAQRAHAEGGGTGDPGNAPAGNRREPAGPGRAVVFLLGPPRIDNLPPPSHTDPVLRPQAMEVLVYLVTHGGSAGKEQILEDILGDAPARRAAGRLSTFVYSLRRSLKTSAGGRDGVYVGAPEYDYVLNRHLIDIDLWRMQVAIAAAGTATDPAARIAALREAAACYTGPLAQGKTYEWIEPYREAVRQQAVDAHLALVGELSGGDPAGAATVLQAAIGHDPYNDALYQQAMRLHARLGDVDAIRSLRRALTRRLGEIDAEPSPDTLALADQLITDLQHRPRAPRSVRGDAA